MILRDIVRTGIVDSSLSSSKSTGSSNKPRSSSCYSSASARKTAKSQSDARFHRLTIAPNPSCRSRISVESGPGRSDSVGTFAICQSFPRSRRRGPDWKGEPSQAHARIPRTHESSRSLRRAALGKKIVSVVTTVDPIVYSGCTDATFVREGSFPHARFPNSDRACTEPIRRRQRSRTKRSTRSGVEERTFMSGASSFAFALAREKLTKTSSRADGSLGTSASDIPLWHVGYGACAR